MVEDLEQDRKALQEAIRFAEEKDKNMDEFLRLLHSSGADWDTVAFYKSMTMVFSPFPFFPDRRHLLPNEILRHLAVFRSEAGQ